MTFRSKYESTRPLLFNYKILSLEANIKLNQGNFTWKLTHKKAPSRLYATHLSN